MTKRNHCQRKLVRHFLCLFFLVNFQYSGTNFLSDMQLPLMASALPLASLFVLFYMGQRIHSNLRDLSDAIYQTEWHRYPRGVRHFIQLMILRSQKPFHLSAYGIIELKLENYVAVSENVCRRMKYNQFIFIRYSILVAQMDVLSIHIIAQNGIIKWECASFGLMITIYIKIRQNSWQMHIIF